METEIKTNAMAATIQLHSEMLNDDAFAGYEGDIDGFNQLYKQVHSLARYELFDGATVDQIVETFYCYLNDVANGDRHMDYFNV